MKFVCLVADLFDAILIDRGNDQLCLGLFVFTQPQHAAFFADFGAQGGNDFGQFRLRKWFAQSR
jgi:hypothetical protein